MLPILRTHFVNGKAVEDVKITVQDLATAGTGDIQHILYSPIDMAAPGIYTSLSLMTQKMSHIPLSDTGCTILLKVLVLEGDKTSLAN
jgi:hypothetical protein